MQWLHVITLRFSNFFLLFYEFLDRLAGLCMAFVQLVCWIFLALPRFSMSLFICNIFLFSQVS